MKFKIPFFLFLIAIVLFIPMRIYLCLVGIDLETGFYVRDNLWGLVFSIALLITLILLALLPHLGHIKDKNMVPVGNKTIGIFALLLGLLMVFEAVSGKFGGLLDYLLHMGDMMTLLQVGSEILGFFGGMIFVVYGIFILLDQVIGGVIAALIMLPSVSFLLALMHDFLEFTTIVTISNRMLLVLFQALAALFILGHGRVVTHVGSPRGIMDSVAFGLGAGLTGFVYTIPRAIASILGRDDTYQIFSIENLVIFVFSIYATIFALYLIKGYAIEKKTPRYQPQKKAGSGQATYIDWMDEI